MKLEMFFTAVTFAVDADGTRVTLENDFVFKTAEELGSLQKCQDEAQILLRYASKHLLRLFRDDTDSRKPNPLRDAKERLARDRVRDFLNKHRFF